MLTEIVQTVDVKTSERYKKKLKTALEELLKEIIKNEVKLCY